MGCLACQPILNTKKRIFGYELLYRTSPNSTEYDAADGSAATRELLATAFGDVGIKKITGGQRSFVNFPARLLEEDIPLLYSKDILVVEVLESVQPTEENIAAIQRLKKHGYMFQETYDSDLSYFCQLAKVGDDDGKVDDLNTIPNRVVISAFMTSELKHAFAIGLFIYIPFIVIDMVVSSTLMAMGMMMLPPATISMPFKIMLFVLVDGWQLTIGTLVHSFGL
jgi:Flagellar biosynthesis pathway, component FliP